MNRTKLPALLGPLGRIFLLSPFVTIYSIGANAGLLSVTLVGDLAGWLLLLSLVYWAYSEFPSTRYWPAYHYGLLLCTAWPVLLPHYIVRTRGWRSWRLLLVLYLAMLAPVVGALAGYALWPHVPPEFGVE